MCAIIRKIQVAGNPLRKRRVARKIVRMNLDALYSELTLKANARLALLVMDGLGDLRIFRQQAQICVIASR